MNGGLRHTEPVEVLAGSGERCSGEAEIINRGSRERLQRAAKVTILLWILAVPAAALPVIHFLLVPLLVLGAPLIGWWVYTKKRAIAATLSCPVCESELRLDQNIDIWPLFEVCRSCKATLQLNQVNP